MNKSIAVLAASAFAITAAACGGSASSGNTAGSPVLNDGAYAYTATSAPTNTCWAPPKTTISLPMTLNVTLTVTGNSILITGSAGGQTASFTATRTGNDLAGTTDSTIDLSTTTLALDCQLAVHGALAGTVTGTDAFDATNSIHITEAGGTQCGTLIGTTLSQQFDNLPCDLVLAGHAVKQ